MSTSICSICKGSEEDHKGARHVFTTVPGDLRAPEPPKPVGPRPPAPDIATPMIMALMNTLAEKDILSREDLLKIFGEAIRPPESITQKLRDTPPSGFADPDRLF